MSDVSIPDYSFLARPEVPQAATNLNALANMQLSAAHAGLYSLQAAKQNMLINTMNEYNQSLQGDQGGQTGQGSTAASPGTNVPTPTMPSATGGGTTGGPIGITLPSRDGTSSMLPSPVGGGSAKTTSFLPSGSTGATGSVNDLASSGNVGNVDTSGNTGASVTGGIGGGSPGIAPTGANLLGNAEAKHCLIE